MNIAPLSTSCVPTPESSSSRRSDRLFIVSITLAVKALLFIFAGQALQVLDDKKLTSLSEWFTIWHRWDSNAYLRLAEFGYRFQGEATADLMFYPLYPWIVRVVALVTRDHFAAALFVSSVASIAAAVILFEIVRLEFSRRTAMLAVWLFLIFPTSYFLHIGYTESMFLALAMGTILAARKEQWMLAGLLGASAGLTRANGLLLIVPLVVEAAHRFSLTRRWNFGWLWLSAVPLGFAGYVAVIANASGDPFAFLQIRQQYFNISIAPPWRGVIAALGQAQSASEMSGVQELIFILLGLACSVVALFKLRPVYSSWLICCWLLAASVTFCQSIPRYTLAMFPIFMLFALAAKRPFWLAVLSAWSLFYLGLFSSQFVWGKWAF